MKFFAILFVLCGISVSASGAALSPADEKAMKIKAIDLVKIVGGRGDNALYLPGPITTSRKGASVTVKFSYHTPDSGVECTTRVDFSKDREGKEVIVILQGVCFS